MKMLEKISLKEILYFLLFLPMLFGGYGYLAGYMGVAKLWGVVLLEGETFFHRK